MTTPVTARPLNASVEIAAPLASVWAIVSDVRRTREWSPECRRVVPFGTVEVGRLFLGVNRRGLVTWATLSRITTYQVEREIGWLVLTNRAEWSYLLQAAGDGTRVTQTRRTPRGVASVATSFAKHLLGGVSGHDDELEAGMHAGLRRIKEIAD